MDVALDSSPESPQPLRVVVTALKGWVERTSPIWVEGQIVQLKRRAGYGVHFLTLRDKLADVSVQVSVSTATLDAAGPITEGTLVAAWMRATVFASNGALTFECRDLRPSGEGRLLAHLEQRKRALQAEGLFNPDRKRPLPFLPTAIGLITGKDSAAERDVVENIARRWPGARRRDPRTPSCRARRPSSRCRWPASLRRPRRRGDGGRHHHRPRRRLDGGSAAVLR